MPGSRGGPPGASGSPRLPALPRPVASPRRPAPGTCTCARPARARCAPSSLTGRRPPGGVRAGGAAGRLARRLLPAGAEGGGRCEGRARVRTGALSAPAALGAAVSPGTSSRWLFRSYAASGQTGWPATCSQVSHGTGRRAPRRAGGQPASSPLAQPFRAGPAAGGASS